MQHQSQNEIRELREVGNRGSNVLVVIPDSPVSSHEAVKNLGEPPVDFHTFVLSGPLPKMNEVEPFTRSLSELLEKQQLKRVTFFGAGAGAAAAQAAAIQLSVRRLVLLNATTRIAPSFADRVIDRIERFLPLGLPLRSDTGAYDSRPNLHRLRCPTLVLVSDNADAFTREQSRYIAHTIPNAWSKTIRHSKPLFSEAICRELVDFLQVATKRPQKNLAAA